MTRGSDVLDTSYSFDALRGIQAGREFYVAMCPLKIIPKLFIFNEEEVSPQLELSEYYEILEFHLLQIIL